ncbi:MAG TPA: serine/threonine-protein kinase [Bryobacteraceae bacterium]|nr:serine/threonine-protein kinase [Bryobacteraceae bacterium]
MNPERFRLMEALYDAAAGMDPGERTRFIEERCADDEKLRRELLAAFREGGSGFTGLVGQAAAATTENQDAWTGRRMGPYRIERPIGRGGMGAVYLAVRDDDEFHKEVAIKTLKFELEGSSAVSRFRHERQILAHLEHPNIARLLDGGTTEQGTPYIVLEYAAGVPITDWCEERHLSIERRLRLFLQVCGAVQYAHQHLIVHRDIKPGNILVTVDGVPKLLDFGIAKLLDADAATGQPMTDTATGAVLMTPDYASPEQVRGAAISTASDVYSLGAVLYELLTGERPHALHNYDAVEIARVVCQTEIRPPSELGNRKLRGDLDNIVLKAMQKEPARRYLSVEQFSEDIRRYLEGLPIIARPDTTVYRAVKFVRRHRIGVTAAAAVVVALATGLVIALHEAQIAQRRFAQVRELANTFLFQFYDQVTPLAGSTAVRASIVDTARKYLDGLSKEAGNDKGLMLELAQAYQRLGDVQGQTGKANLGQVEEARRSYQRAQNLYARLRVNRSSPEDLRLRLANLLVDSGRLEYNSYHEEAAGNITRQALDLLADRTPDAAIRRWRAQGESSLGQIRVKLGQTAEGLALLESAAKALQDLRSAGYADPALPDVISYTQERLAQARVSTGDLEGAVSAFQDLLRTSAPCDETAPPGAACRALAVRLSWTADVYAAVDRPNLNEPGKAAELYERSVHIQERIAALDAHDRQARFDLAARYGKLGDAVWQAEPNRALDLYERALATAKALASKEQLNMLKGAYLAAISRPLIKLGRTAEARKALTEYDEMESANPPSTAYADLLGDVSSELLWPPLLAAEGKRAEAQQKLNEIIRSIEKLRAGHPTDLTPVYYLSSCYRQLAALHSGEERRQALLRSAEAWHSWPATSYTKREEGKDLAAANR